MLVTILFSKKGFEWVQGQIFFGPPTLTGHSFAAPLAKMMNSSSFESPKPYLFGYYLKNSITALLRYVILAQSTPILLHTEGLVSFVSLSTVSLMKKKAKPIIKMLSAS